MSNYYMYDQNNSGGNFVYDEKLTHRVVVEADSEDEAIKIGKSLGIYFNGCDKGIDCPCCGDRWYRPDHIKFPINWDNQKLTTLKEYLETLVEQYAAMADVPDIRVFHKSGDIDEYQQTFKIPKDL